MNNDLSDEDEDILMTKMFAEEKPADKKEFAEFSAPFSEIENEENLLEIPEAENTAPYISESNDFAAEPTNLDPLIETPSNNFDAPTADFQVPPESASAKSFVEDISEKPKNEYPKDDAPIFQSSYQPESSDETVRKSGLAYSAAVILIGSIVFTLILGWFADLLFGTSPWGKVAGIILGAIIGFIQFFRTTSQILKDKD